MPDTAVTNPQVVVNNTPVPVKPNSVSFTEGKGEQNQRVQSAGGGNVDMVVSDDVETHKSMVRFRLLNTQANIDLIRQWKSNSNNNAVSITGQGVRRTFPSAVLTSDYEVNLGADSDIEVEFHTAPAV